MPPNSGSATWIQLSIDIKSRDLWTSPAGLLASDLESKDGGVGEVIVTRRVLSAIVTY
jgi:hypothetical protein